MTTRGEWYAVAVVAERSTSTTTVRHSLSLGHISFISLGYYHYYCYYYYYTFPSASCAFAANIGVKWGLQGGKYRFHVFCKI
jgi:hypothetical protein